jgi:hypothetical protein
MNWRIVQLADAEFHIEVPGKPGVPIAIVQTAEAAVAVIVALRKAGQ